MPQLPLHQMSRIASSAAVSAAPVRVHAVLLTPGTAAASVKLTNDANGSGTTVLLVTAPANGPSVLMDFANLGPFLFDAKCYATLAGTGAEAYVWYE